MKTFLGSIRHLLATCNKVHIVWCAVLLLMMIILGVIHHKWRDDRQKLGKWRILALLPLLICIVHFLIYARTYPQLAGAFECMYIIGIISLIPMLFAKRKIGFPITATLTGILSGLLGLYFCGSSPNYFSFAGESYTESFHSAVQKMDETYVLKEWKEVDFKALEDKYMPMVEEAEKEQDIGKYCDAVSMFCDELHDGHVWIETDFDRKENPSQFQLYDHGLSMVQLDSGEVIAVCTSEEVQKLGIEDGTVITKWDGKPVLQAAEEDVMDQGAPVLENEKRLRLFNLAGVGGETVEVTFLDKSGKEQTVTLTKSEEIHAMKEALNAFSHSPDISSEENYREYMESNFSTKMLDDKCGYLCLIAEGTDSGVHDILGYLMGNHKWAREMFREKLTDLKAQGMEYLVIDLRNNGGGFDEIGCALCDLLTDGEWYGQGLGIRKNGEYTCVSDHCIHGTGEFKDLKIIALTNYNCASAGDGTSLYLSKLPNVTLAGLTDPEGCNQETGGMCILSEGKIAIFYPTGLILNEDCEPNVDTKADRISRNPVDVRIPLDYDAAMKIFHDKEDYELDWALNYIENQ